MSSRLEALQKRGVIFSDPSQVTIADDILEENIEAGVTILPGTILEGPKTLLGKGSVLGPHATFRNVRCGRNGRLNQGYYDNCVFLDGAKVRGGAEIRGGTLFMEEAEAAHTVGCKMTILGIKVVLGSLINFCDAFITGGTDEPFGFTEIGSGAIHYNFTPSGLKFGSLVGPGAAGEMFGLFPKTFLGGQTQIIAPTMIGHQVLIPAGTAVRTPVAPGFLSIEAALKPCQKPYEPALLTSVKEKFLLTAVLIFHYQALRLYFQTIRARFAEHQKDIFLQKLFQAAQEMILINQEERLRWIFDQKENGKPADLFSKLPQSLALHHSALKQASGNAVSFHLDQIEEQEALLKNKEIWEQKLRATCPANEAPPSFLLKVEKALGRTTYQDYLDFIRQFPQEGKIEGQKWLESLVQARLQDVKEGLSKKQSMTEIAIQSQQYKRELAPYFRDLRHLYQQNKFFFNGNWHSPQLGLLNGDLDEYCDLKTPAWQILSLRTTKATFAKFEILMGLLKKWPHPTLFLWPYLLSMLSQLEQTEITGEILRRAAYCFHGTDGLRGTTVVDQAPLLLPQALRRFLEKHEITPEFLQALARNTVYAFEILYDKKIDAVAVGCDPRDIYIDDPQKEKIFYQAVLDGLLSTGKAVYDLGVVPIPCIPYALAYWDCEDSPAEITLALYKSASHNPACQDGLKVFVKTYDSQGSPIYVKAPLSLEFTVAALLYEEAVTQKKTKDKGLYHKADKIASEILTRSIQDSKNFPVLKDIAFLVLDLAHGAFAHPLYQKILEESLEKTEVENFVFVGNAPNGKNINSNEGQDRVGAAHLENVHEIQRKDTEPGGKFFGFPALKALMDFGKANALRLQKESSAWAIFVDGDGDRSYASVYDPFNDCLHVIDGDEALYYQTMALAQAKKIKPGTMVAFTVESSVPFINALSQSLSEYYPTQLLLADGVAAAQDKVNLKLCPVGDKHILRQQCLGAESSGHIVKPYQIAASDMRTRHRVFTGNGIFSGAHTMTSFLTMVEASRQDPKVSFVEKWKTLLRPYPKPYNTMVYIYFVNKKLWYRGSALWQNIYESLAKACAPQELHEVHFREEADTLYLLCMEKNNTIRFAILARPSGTENKFGIKFFGSEKEKAFFEEKAEALFVPIAKSLKDYSLKICEDERKILAYLLAHEDRSVSLDELQQKFLAAESVASKAYFMSIIEALSEKCQKMISYDGSNLKINPRGKQFLAGKDPEEEKQ